MSLKQLSKPELWQLLQTPRTAYARLPVNIAMSRKYQRKTHTKAAGGILTIKEIDGISGFSHRS
jgi:hypothetical protein